MAKDSYSSEEMERYFNDPEFRRKLIQRMKGLTRNQVLMVWVGIAIAAVFITWYGFYIASGLPPLEKLENPRPELATKIYSVDGEVLDQFAIKNRTRISLDKLPPGLVQALISTEDKQFYHHWGIHLTRVFKALVKNVATFSIREGASTITQQLARNMYLKPDRNVLDKITRKFRELVTSVQIERNFTKDEILELYLNVAFFGRQAYGIESAAQTYFGKPASDLRMGEYTMLVGMLKGPSYYDPVNHLDRSLRRRDIVLGQMVKDGILSPDSADLVRRDSLNIRVTENEFRTGIAPHYVEWIRRLLLTKAEKYGFDIYRDGLQVYTTLDSRMQKNAIRAIEEHLNVFQRGFDSTFDWKARPEILKDDVDKMIHDTEPYRKARNATMRDSILEAYRSNPAFVDSVKRVAQTIEVGFVVIDPHNGHILSMVGGRNFRQFKYGLNHVTQIRRQPGSAFKPFVYTVALDNGYPPCYELWNLPVTIPMPDGTRWTPENFDKSIGGKYTLREAVKESINLIAVRAILEIAPAKQVAEYAHRMGIHSPIPPYESIALGSVEVSPLELTSSFGVFPNEGVLVNPIAILRIEDKDGNVIEENEPEKHEVLSKETAYLMTDLLKGVVNGGTAYRAIRSFYTGQAAGKTGTTNDYGDAWFVGFTPQLVAGVWVGFDDGRIKFGSSDGQGGRAAAPMIGRFLQYTYEDPVIGLQQEYFTQPDGIETDTICVDTKKKAREFCPNKETEIINSKYPLALCDKHTSANWNQGDVDEARKKSKVTW
ncbi:MAG TPA: PBP1A family penicillin-binding protein [Bacteroidota bacterium]|nr:PBP1A family penicillin-binding protein [Bacteroidota bacterium]